MINITHISDPILLDTMPCNNINGRNYTITDTAITRVVYVMLENRSFDHMLGSLGFINPNIDGLQNAPSSIPENPHVSGSPQIQISLNSKTYATSNPTHNFLDVATQINGGAMDGFSYASQLTNKPTTDPNFMLSSEELPVMTELATMGAVFDKFFVSVPSGTNSNRAYSLTGTSHGSATAPPDVGPNYIKDTTYIDYLNERGISAGAYYTDDYWFYIYFDDLNTKEANRRNVREFVANFAEDVENDNLPQFTHLQPRAFTHGSRKPTWQMPTYSIDDAEQYLQEIYEILRASDRWNETLFLITYDEHGGFYDHVAPPSTNVPNPDGLNDSYVNFNFDSLGVRVPLLGELAERSEAKRGGAGLWKTPPP